MFSPAIQLSAPFNFILPEQLKAKEPAEVRGIARDNVKLLVIDRHNKKTHHTNFIQLSDYLKKNDLLVFNSSRTLPAVLKGYSSSHQQIEIRLAEHLPDNSWLALIMIDNKPATNNIINKTIDFSIGLNATVLSRDSRIAALWQINFSKKDEALLDAIYRIGQPVRYEYVSEPWALDYYQTVYAKEPGSAEMPSAGRAFTWKMIFDLKRRGINTAYITLHTGLSSYMDDKADAMHIASDEEYIISENAAKKITDAKQKGGKIIAVGTTVVKALESSALLTGSVEAAHDYTHLYISADHSLKIVDGLITGLHEPEASHLEMLSAFVSPATLKSAYEEAIKKNYLWHEFGDLNLIL